MSAPVRPLAAQLRDAALALGGMLAAGEFAGASADALDEIAALARALAGWARLAGPPEHRA